MTRNRPALVGLSLIVLGVLGACWYLYQNLPAILQQQARHHLQQYGVQDIAFEPVQISRNSVLIHNLQLRGRYGNFDYVAQLDSTKVRYDWRVLLNGKIQSLVLSGLHLAVTQSATADSATPEYFKIDDVLPHQLIENLPLGKLQIENWQLEFQSAAKPLISATGSVFIEDQLDLQLVTVLGGRDVSAALRTGTSPRTLDLDIVVVDADTEIAGATARLNRVTLDQWEWQLQGHWQYTPLLAWLRRFSAEQGLQQHLPLLNALDIQGQSSFTAQIHHPDTLRLGAASGTPAPLLQQLSATIQLENEIRELGYEGAIKGLNGTVNMQALLANGQFEATLQPAEIAGELATRLLSPSQETQRWPGWGETVPLRFAYTEPLKILRGSDGSWTVQLRNTVLTLGDKDTALGLHALDLDATLAGGELWPLKTQLDTSIRSRLRKHLIPDLTLTLSQHGNSEHSEFDLQLDDAAKSLRASVQGQLNPTSGRGEYRLNVQSEDLARFGATTLPLLSQFQLLPKNSALVAGHVALSTALKTREFSLTGATQHSQLRLQDVVGSVGDYRFDRLALAADWTGITQWQTRQPVELSVAELNLGFKVQDIRLRVSLPKATAIAQPQLRIDAFSAGMFGGQLLLPQPQSWDFAAKANQLTLQARQWQLAELVALQKNADIQAQGTLEGELPVTIADGRIIIKKGYLRALPPGGSIRYTANDASKALASNSAELRLALNLLSDLQYQVLSSVVNLDAAGNLLLELSLEGSNPSQYGGQPVNFNINLEQNLDPLLQSLRLSGTLVERIEGGLH